MGNETEARRRALWARQDRQIKSRTPPRLDDGRRLIRVFPEYTTDLPLWENFTDHYLVERGMLPLSSDLDAALAEWNEKWSPTRSSEDPEEQRWLAQGHALVRRLRTELHGIAEIRAEFAD
ncbi:hypothetical protein [Microbacterium oleivorans]|uniref:Putative membrane protein n=1 Tax=Microbacterium oleivorans TaxID=273677 RepID=A0A031FUE8_9MICO|nr:hypothetical protein [Microbacterium oleivorans]AZS42984.1 hypothetical protein BWL13_00526 [Microbacterium oleivorans]EZP28178.1 putative membrane protein [Microbacterium oleivorans]THE07009.1 hypothetical protein E1I21_09290 [Microbacterium oleivorans]